MSSLQIRDRSYFSCFELPNSFLQSKWFIVALAVSSLVFFGAAAFGGAGLFTSHLPQWLAHAVGTIGHSGCLMMFIGGTILGGACIIITAATLPVRRNNEESIEILNDRLIQAVQHVQIDQINIIQDLLDRGANIEARSENGNTPLIWASYLFNTNVVTILLDHNANIEATNSSDGWTPLMMATQFDHVNIARKLLDHGANVEAIDLYGKTSLMLAALLGHDNLVTILLEYGANIEATDQGGWTPLMESAFGGNTNVVNALLEGGANVEVTDNKRKTAIDHARTEEIRQILVDWQNTHR